MTQETLLSAARRVVRFMNIDLNKGGLVSIETQLALDTLDKMVRRESEKQAKQNNQER